MTRVLAAVDASPVTRQVLETAVVFGNLLDASPDAVYVEDDGGAMGEMAERVKVPLRVLHGVPEQVIVREAAADDVVLTVIGARGLAGGRQPAGHVTLHVMQRSSKPVVVVPPDCGPPKLGRVLVPLDGSRDTGLAVADIACQLDRAGATLVLVHTITPETTPAMLNHGSALELWGREFVLRACPELADSKLELRVGVPATCVMELARDEQVDLIVLGWSRELSGGHGQVVLDSVTRAAVPTLLLAVDGRPEATGSTTFTAGSSAERAAAM